MAETTIFKRIKKDLRESLEAAERHIHLGSADPLDC